MTEKEEEEIGSTGEIDAAKSVAFIHSFNLTHYQRSLARHALVAIQRTLITEYAYSDPSLTEGEAWEAVNVALAAALHSAKDSKLPRVMEEVKEVKRA